MSVLPLQTGRAGSAAFGQEMLNHAEKTLKSHKFAKIPRSPVTASLRSSFLSTGRRPICRFGMRRLNFVENHLGSRWGENPQVQGTKHSHWGFLITAGPLTTFRNCWNKQGKPMSSSFRNWALIIGTSADCPRAEGDKQVFSAPIAPM